MKVGHYTEIEEKPVEATGAVGATVRWLIAKEDGAPNFAMRVFTLSPGGSSPHHTHSFEHEVFFLEGEGEVFMDGKTYPVKKGFFAFIPGGVEHQIRNKGKGDLRFICVVPI